MTFLATVLYHTYTFVVKNVLETKETSSLALHHIKTDTARPKMNQILDNYIKLNPKAMIHFQSQPLRSMLAMVLWPLHPVMDSDLKSHFMSLFESVYTIIYTCYIYDRMSHLHVVMVVWLLYICLHIFM